MWPGDLPTPAPHGNRANGIGYFMYLSWNADSLGAEPVNAAWLERFLINSGVAAIVLQRLIYRPIWEGAQS